jgi:SH3-like domain-containing protein
MAQPKRGPAALVAWKSPEDQPLSLSPAPEDGASLDVEIEDGAVTIRGRNCRFVWCDVNKKQKQGEKVLAEVEITVPLAQCQINWRFVEAELPE